MKDCKKGVEFDLNGCGGNCRECERPLGDDEFDPEARPKLVNAEAKLVVVNDTEMWTSEETWKITEVAGKSDEDRTYILAQGTNTVVMCSIYGVLHVEGIKLDNCKLLIFILDDTMSANYTLNNEDIEALFEYLPSVTEIASWSVDLAYVVKWIKTEKAKLDSKIRTQVAGI